MNPTRILPDLQCSLVCEEIRQEVNGNLFLIGVVNVIRVPQVPIMAGRICIFNRWTAGIGQFKESTRLIAPDQTTVVAKAENKFELRDPSHSMSGGVVFGNVKIETAGTYFVEVTIEEVMKLRYPLVIAHVPPPQQQQPPAPAKG
jgi:hypothetical protein